MKVHFRPEAVADLDRAFFAVVRLSKSIATAEKYTERLRSRCFQISDLPYGGQAHDELSDGMRIVHFEKSAVIVYRVNDSRVTIVNIFAAGEDYGQCFVASARGTKTSRAGRSGEFGSSGRVLDLEGHDKLLAQRAERLLELLDFGVVRQVQEPVDLGRLPAEDTDEVGLAKVLRTHQLIK